MGKHEDAKASERIGEQRGNRPAIVDLSTMRLQAGDIILLRADDNLTPEQSQNIRAGIEAGIEQAGITVPIPILILEKGMELLVMRAMRRPEALPTTPAPSEQGPRPGVARSDDDSGREPNAH